MKNLLGLITGVCGIVFLTSCNTAKPATAQSGSSELLYVYRWELTELNGKPFEKTDRIDPYLLFHPGETGGISGSPGCNQLAGKFKLSDGHLIKISPVVTTKMDCPDTDLEYQFVTVLGLAESWQIGGNELRLEAGQNMIARFAGIRTDR